MREPSVVWRRCFFFDLERVQQKILIDLVWILRIVIIEGQEKRIDCIYLVERVHQIFIFVLAVVLEKRVNVAFLRSLRKHVLILMVFAALVAGFM
jgi:hypothetical protein